MNCRPESWSEVKMVEVTEEPEPSNHMTTKKNEEEDDEEDEDDSSEEDSDFDLGGNPNRRRFYVERDSEEDSD